MPTTGFSDVDSYKEGASEGEGEAGENRRGYHDRLYGRIAESISEKDKAGNPQGYEENRAKGEDAVG